MNVTFLVGNGFDVGMGMKSRFSDFFPIYCKNSINKEERIKQFSERISADNNSLIISRVRSHQFTVEIHQYAY